MKVHELANKQLKPANKYLCISLKIYQDNLMFLILKKEFSKNIDRTSRGCFNNYSGWVT